VNKCESQLGEFDQLKLKNIVLQDDRDEEINMTQPVGFTIADLVSVDD